MNVDEFLAHNGVKGMHWGVRKVKPTSATVRSSKVVESGKGWIIDKEGRVTIGKGAVISRVVRNHSGIMGGVGADWHAGGPVYAAFKPNDINAYEHFFGRTKSLFVKNASVVLKLTPTTTLHAPGPKEATALYFDMVKKDPDVKAELNKLLKGPTKANLKRALQDPTSQKAYETYSIAIDAGNYSRAHGSVNQKYFRELNKRGYNMLVDPVDAAAEFDAPIIVLNGKKTLELQSQHIVDKVSAHKARLAYASEPYVEGKRYLSQQGYFVS